MALPTNPAPPHRAISSAHILQTTSTGDHRLQAPGAEGAVQVPCRGLEPDLACHTLRRRHTGSLLAEGFHLEAMARGTTILLRRARASLPAPNPRISAMALRGPRQIPRLQASDLAPTDQSR